MGGLGGARSGVDRTGVDMAWGVVWWAWWGLRSVGRAVDRRLAGSIHSKDVACRVLVCGVSMCVRAAERIVERQPTHSSLKYDTSMCMMNTTSTGRGGGAATAAAQDVGARREELLCRGRPCFFFLMVVCRREGICVKKAAAKSSHRGPAQYRAPLYRYADHLPPQPT